LGTELPELASLDSSKRSKSQSHVRNGRPALIVLLPGDGPQCGFPEKELLRAASELAELGWVLIPAVTGNPAGCSSQMLMHLAPSTLDVNAPAFLLVDKSGVLRRVVQKVKSPLSADRLIDEVRYWLDGIATFKAQCARCHGEDGRDTTYPGTKSLAGIGNRHTEAEILEMTQLAGFVDLSYLSERAKKALAAFVAGL
jgi:cytochrome c553